MNRKTTWLLTTQILALGVGMLLYGQGKTRAAFWLLTVDLLCVTAWVVLDAILGMRMLRWLQNGNFTQPPRTLPSWQEYGEATLAVRRKFKRKTAQAKEKLRAFLHAIQTLPIGVVLLDETGRIEWFNHIAAEHLGLNDPQDLQQHIVHLVRDPQFVNHWLHKQNEQNVTIHGRQHSPQNPIKVSIQTFEFGAGKCLLLSRDVTLLEQTDRVRRDFVSNVSHEIRTPLTVLAGFVETLQTLPLDTSEQQHYLHLMAEQAHRMQLLVDDLLMLSRLEGSPQPGAGEHVLLAELLQQCVHDAESLSRVLGNGQNAAHHITLESTIDAQPAPPPDTRLHLIGNRKELRSAISNLLSNAVRYTPAGGRITLQAALTPAGSLRMTVHDTGPGIARKHLSRITERFYRIDKSRSRETGGTGLGLAIVKHVAQRHQATLEIDSQVGHGSSFTLHFEPQRLLRKKN